MLRVTVHLRIEVLLIEEKNEEKKVCKKVALKKASTEQKADSTVVTVSIVTAICLIGDSMLYIALPIFWREAGLDALWQVGVLLAVNRFIRLPIHPFIGWVYQKISLKTGLLIAVLLGTVTTFGYGVITGFIGWLILRALWGVAWSLFRIGGLTAVTAVSTDRNRGQTMGMYNGLYRLGSLFGMLVGGILAPIIGLQYVALIFGVCSLGGVFYLLHSFRSSEAGAGTTPQRTPAENMPSKDVPSVQNKTDQRKLRLLFPKGTFPVIAIGLFVPLLFQGILMATLSPLIGHLFAEPIHVAGLLLSVTALSGIIQAARWIWEPFLARRLGALSDGPQGRLPLLIFSLIFAAVVCAVLPLSMPLLVWVAISLLILVSGTALTTLTDALASDLAKRTNAVSFLTLYSVAQDIGAASGPFLSFLVISLPFGFVYLYGGSSFMLLCFAGIWLRIYLLSRPARSLSL
jgi:MFS family permease